jgi:hypothetical protein
VEGERGVDHNYHLASADVACILEREEKIAYLEIRTSRVEMQVHALRRRPDVHWTYIQRIVLLVIRSYLAGLLLALVVDLAQNGLRGAFGLGEKTFLSVFFVLSMRWKGPAVVGAKSYFWRRLA